MTGRLFLNAISAPPAYGERQLAAWGNVSGSAAPSLDTPSFGVSSITDAGAGLLDVTWERAFGGSATYIALACTQIVDGEIRLAQLTNTVTSTAVRFAFGTNALADLATGGAHFMAVGI